MFCSLISGVAKETGGCKLKKKSNINLFVTLLDETMPFDIDNSKSKKGPQKASLN